MSLLLIMGLPAAGKTTLCSKITERLPNAIVFSLDDVNGRWSDEFRAHTDRKSFEQCVRFFLEQNCDEEFDRTVIVDDNFYLRSMRRPFERMARAFGLRYCCVLVDCDVQDALHRNSSRGENRVSDETILKMDREMEVPADALLHRYQGVEEILQRVNGLRMKRVQSSKRSPSESSRSFLSEIDGILRAEVSEAVRQDLDGRILASAKKAVLNKYRQSKNSLLPDQVREELLKEYFVVQQNKKNGGDE